MLELRRRARLAGFLYLLLCLTAPFRLMVIPSLVPARGEPSATVAALLTHEGLFRWGIVSDLLCGALLIIILRAFQRLFREVDPELGFTLLILGGILPSALYFVNTVNDAAALLLARGDILTTFSPLQRADLAQTFLRLHGQAILAAEILWGLWLFPLGRLTWRSGFLPKLLGGWLYLNGLAYLALSLTGFLAPAWAGTLERFTFPLQLGEVAFMLYLLLVGARPGPAASVPRLK